MNADQFAVDTKVIEMCPILRIVCLSLLRSVKLMKVFLDNASAPPLFEGNLVYCGKFWLKIVRKECMHENRP